MKVLDLRCANDHAFEGWFASEDDFQGQCVRGLLQCPVCGDTQVRKMLSAPRIQRGAAAERSAPAQAPVPDSGTASPPASSRGALPAALQAAWLQWARQAATQSEDVGERFAQEARNIHRGDSPERAIRGQASAAQALELLEEGIPVLALPATATDTLH
jgi:hypothetical protein